jgi:hypothetical protein
MILWKTAKFPIFSPFYDTPVPKLSWHVIAKNLCRQVYCNAITMSMLTKNNVSSESAEVNSFSKQPISTGLQQTIIVRQCLLYSITLSFSFGN